ncbi:LysM peptidoglycan-binding domain-containing protein [Bacillus salipaludis]|uniref:LysM peptidoglycan-binding domain-containing protein n=1 Tax=Bacillus salipaludis TaxID=2547811 RepID=A0AA90QSU5_9BACI|nr:LysM peptidoglycan-binding domain-containing protein [Bacillus salipaludis]MDQ6598975.1 LysM peptidoglycan-binding domain-containing protein [Bacillus salipaludis]
MQKRCDEMAVHVVRKGENLWGISTLYGIPMQTIAQVNGLTSSTSLVPGLALYIPDKLMPIRYYRIKAGDHIWQLANQFNTSTAAILAANQGISPNRLVIGQIIAIPSAIKMEIATLGFIVPSAIEDILSTLDTLANQLTYLAIVAYSFTEEGFAFNEIEDSDIVTKCNQLNITPLLMIRNYTKGDFSAELAGKVLENPVYRQNLIASIVNLTIQRGFGGVSIDLEFIPPPRRQDFNKFLTDLKRALGNLILHVNVHAKTADIPTNRIIGAYDYKAIGNAADIVAVMSIDYGYPTGPPDPIAPITWMEQVVRYSLTQINPRKLQIALPLYGYDKIASTHSTHALSVLAAQNQAIATGQQIQFDNSAKSPWYRYWKNLEEHVVWFEDVRSYMEKYKLMDVYLLLGTTFWQLSLPAPQNWEYLSQNISVVKNII